mgnify:CR=1 FL=1
MKKGKKAGARAFTMLVLPALAKKAPAVNTTHEITKPVARFDQKVPASEMLSTFPEKTWNPFFHILAVHTAKQVTNAVATIPAKTLTSKLVVME